MGIVKYVIADDHKIFRQGLQYALNDDPMLEFVGEAGNGLELLDLIKEQQTDIALVDLKMPEMDGNEATKRIIAEHPEVKVIILTMFDDEHFITHMMEAGANGYLTKNADPSEIKKAIHAVHETGYYFSDLVSSSMLRSLMQKNKSATPFKAEVKLNERELEVLQLICKEHTAAEIAQKIFLSPRTVEGIKANLLEKIGVRNTVGLVMYAVKHGIIN